MSVQEKELGTRSSELAQLEKYFFYPSVRP